MAEGEVKSADMSAGNITHTGRKLDVSMLGDAMMAVQSIDGTESYTRRGDLTISPTGVLENGDGRPVIGNGGLHHFASGRTGVHRPGWHDPCRQCRKPRPAAHRGRPDQIGQPGRFNYRQKVWMACFVWWAGASCHRMKMPLVPESLEQSNVNPSEA
jgi:hypothetical protein